MVGVKGRDWRRAGKGMVRRREVEKRGGGRCKPRFRRREVEKGVGRSEVEKGSWETGGGKGGLEREVEMRGGGKKQATISINIHKYCQMYTYYIYTIYSYNAFMNLESNLSKVLDFSLILIA